MARTTTGLPPIYEVKAQLFKSLAHPARVRVLELLVDGERQVSELITETGLEPSHLSQHLAVLRRAGVVEAQRSGNVVRYRLVDDSVAAMLSAARSFLTGSLARTRANLSELDAEST